MPTNQPDLSGITIDDLYDIVILSHGYTSYKRDYYFHLETSWNGELAGQYLLLFRHCYEMHCEIIPDGKALNQAWDDSFIDMNEHKKAGEPEGYVWGTNWLLAYPGFKVIQDSERAVKWASLLKREMQEVEVQAELVKLNLIFHDWNLKKLSNETGLIKQVFLPLQND